MFSFYKWSIVPLNALWHRYVENSKGLIGQVQNQEVLPWVLKKFEKYFVENGYTYETPMTNDDFRKNSPDKTPVWVESFKTKYTNHYIEYQKAKTELLESESSIKEFVDVNNSILKHVVFAGLLWLVALYYLITWIVSL